MYQARQKLNAIEDAISAGRYKEALDLSTGLS